MKSTRICVLIVISILSFPVLSQDTLKVSKSEILNLATQQNLQLKVAESSLASAKADFRQSNALFLPSISASHTAMTTTNPLMAFGSKLNQEILTASDFDPNRLNNPDRINNFATRIEVLQPIINIDGWNERKAAKARMQAFEYQNERTKEYLQLEVAQAYMQLQLAYSATQVLEKANSTVMANLKLVQDYFTQGLLQKTDVLDVQVRANTVANQLQFAKSNVKNASDYLAFLMGETSANYVYMPTETLDKNMQLQEQTLQLSENRKDILALNKSTEAYEKMWASSKMQFLPKLNAFGTYELYDREVFSMGASGYTIGAQLSWNVFDGYKSIGKLEKNKAELEKNKFESAQYKAQSQLEINKTFRQVQDAEFKVKNTKLALEQAQESYTIKNNRFKQGLEKTSDVLIAESQMAEREMNHLQAIFEYNVAQYYLNFLTQN